MQLYALDKNLIPIFAEKAGRQVNYTCAECHSTVRLRGGVHRQKHFYHLEPKRKCRLNGKGMIHLQSQLYLLNVLTEDEAQLEVRFTEINRIADVVWKSEKIVFEIQYSSISAEEVLKRNRDYASLGWQVVWILHDHRYNAHRLTAAEVALRSHPYYFTNMNAEGIGIIYDQFDLFHKGKRVSKLGKLPIDIRKKQAVTADHLERGLCLVKQRVQSWPLYFQGDLIQIALSLKDLKLSQYMKEALQKEAQHQKMNLSTVDNSLIDWVKWSWVVIVQRPYSLMIQILLERMCR